MPVQHAQVSGALPPLDDAFFHLLAMIRRGDLAEGRTLTEPELVDMLATTAVRIRPAVAQLVAIGLFRALDHRAVVVTAPTLDEWADTLRYITGLNELSARWSIPTFDADDDAAFAALFTRARQQAALHDIGFTETMINITRFFADRSSNALVWEAVRTTVRRLAYMVNPTPPYQQWEMRDYFDLIEEAVAERDPELAAEASHVLIRHIEQHIVATKAGWATMGR